MLVLGRVVSEAGRVVLTTLILNHGRSFHDFLQVVDTDNIGRRSDDDRIHSARLLHQRYQVVMFSHNTLWLLS